MTMMIRIYDLKEEGIKFRSDFNRSERYSSIETLGHIIR